jgi:microcystin-dependent protein
LDDNHNTRQEGEKAMNSFHLKRLLIALVVVASSFAVTPAARAQASDPFIGQLMWVGFNFCPTGWAAADGALLQINQNQALFALLGTYYGGDGRTTFALPDLRGRAAVHAGTGPGLSTVLEGQQGGAEQQTLNFAQMPAHSHTASTTLAGLQITSTLRGSSSSNTTTAPAGAALGVSKKQSLNYVAAAPDVDMSAGSVQSTVTGTATTTVDATNSGSSPVPVRDPYLGLRACIALSGVFPSRN